MYNTYLTFQRDTDLIGTISTFQNMSHVIPNDVTFSVWAKFRAQERVVFASEGDYKFSPFLFTENGLAALTLDGQIYTTDKNLDLIAGWHHFVFAVNEAEKELKTYYDGVLSEVVTLAADLTEQSFFGGEGVKNGLNFGRFSRWTDDGYLTKFWPFAGLYGFMDEVSMWATALSAEEIAKVYENGLDPQQTRVASEYLFLCYDFEEKVIEDGLKKIRNLGTAGKELDGVLAGYASSAFPGQVLTEWGVETDEGCDSKVAVTEPLLVNDEFRKNEANVAPICESQKLEVVEGSEVVFYAYGYDANGDWLDYSIVSLPRYGQLYEVDNVYPENRVRIDEVPYVPTFKHFRFVFDPTDQSFSFDSFHMIATDSHGASSEEATIGVDIITANDIPTAEDTVVMTREEESIVFHINVTDTDSKFLSAIITSVPEYGVLHAHTLGEHGDFSTRINMSYIEWSSIEPLYQYASKVNKVSTFWGSGPNDDYEFPYWHPYMATGPQSVDVYGDSREAWSPLNRNAPEGVFEGGDSLGLLVYGPWNPREAFETEGYSEFIELDFDHNVYLENLVIGMPRGMGSVVGVKAWDNLTSSWQTVFSGDADADFERYMQLTKQYDDFEPNPLCNTMYTTRRVRIELDTVTVSDWNEIDYVELIGATTKQDAALRVDNGVAKFVYTPSKDFAGVDKFTVKFCDCGDKRCSYDVTVDINIENVNDAPEVPEGITMVASECELGGAYTFDLPASDADYNETLTYTIASFPDCSVFQLLQPEDDGSWSEVKEFPFIVENGHVSYRFVGNESSTGPRHDASSDILINYTVSDSAGENVTGIINLVCSGVTCAAGSFYDGEECSLCPPGRFASDEGERTACDACEPGQYQSEYGATICLACGLTQFSTSGAGASRCTCLPGSHRAADGALCELCEPGFYTSEVDSDVCIECTPGSYPSDSEDDNDGAGVTFGAKSCNPCPSNSFSNDPKTALCAPCPLLRTSEPGSTYCGECDEYTYLDLFEPNEDDQCKECVTHVECVAGTTLETWNVKEGFWRAGPHARQVYECPPLSRCMGGVGNTGEGDSICDDHFVGRLCSWCEPRFYLTASGCRGCTPATNEFIVIVSVVVTTVVVIFLLFISSKPEFIIELQKLKQQYSTRSQSLVRKQLTKVQSLRKKLSQDSSRKQLSEKSSTALADATDSPDADPKVMPSSGQSMFDSAKTVGSEGAKQEEDEPRGNPWSSVLPIKCPEERSDGIELSSSHARDAANLENGGHSSTSREIALEDQLPFTESEREDKVEAAQNSVALMRMYSMLSVKWKIIISALQILASNSKSFMIDWPPIISSFMGFFSALNVDVFFFPQLACMRNLNHYDRLLAGTAFPLILIAGIAFCLITPLEALSRSKTCWYRRQHSKLAMAIIVLFFAYSSASQVIALTFVCQNFEEEGKSFLRADLSLRCGGLNYKCWFAFAVFMTFVWPLGMPSLFFFLCWREKKRIDPMNVTKKHAEVSQAVKNANVDKAVAQRQFDPDIHATKCLWLPYEPEFWYWESIISAQRMMLTFVASLVRPGTPVQPIFCLCTVIFFLRLQAFYNPYCHDQDDILAEGLSWMLIFFYIQALLYMLDKVGGFTMDVLLCTSIGLAILGTIFLMVTDFQRELAFFRIIRKWMKRKLPKSKMTIFSPRTKASTTKTTRESWANFMKAAEKTTRIIRRANKVEVNTPEDYEDADDDESEIDDNRLNTYDDNVVDPDESLHGIDAESPPASPTDSSPFIDWSWTPST